MMKRQHCVSCGAHDGMLHFEGRDFEVRYRQSNNTVLALSGWACDQCAEVEFDSDSALRYAQAGDHLIHDSRRKVAEEMKRIRRKLNFTQRTAVQLLSGGGHNAFSRYERAEVEPPKALLVLMQLLDRHPELVSDVREMSEG